MYLLAQASDTIIDKLSYIDTRVEDITELSVKVKASQGEIEITDIMRFFSGDHPEQNSERGSKREVNIHVQIAGQRLVISQTFNTATAKNTTIWRTVDRR